jgi:hypothetical protein
LARCLEKQLEQYVPVVVAARGAEEANEAGRSETGAAVTRQVNPAALAADQFVASKVLHQLRSRFEVTSKGLDRLEQSLEVYWSEVFGDAAPERCRLVLSDQRRRRGA